MKMKMVLLLLTFFITQVATGQVLKDRKLKDDAMDAFTELDEEALTLRFFDAVTGKSIADARVEIQDIGDFVTDFEGRATFPIPEEDGYHEVQFSRSGYVETKFRIEITAGTLFFNRFSISPAMPIGYLRVVLDWDAEPGDLDAHFIKRGAYHISFRNMRVADDGIARLDRDDRNGYGPETITAKTIDEYGDYVFAVHDYTNRNESRSNALSQSKACVKVFSRDRLMGIFYVPQNEQGNYWEVFKIVNGQIIPLAQSITTMD
ncbi:hypothetical protein Ctha_2184 [Chloroherpeton thalassium ATCC 35110]|uniref:Carboxypeptidase regulatory-like domain-containing protein n=1 Tax=Chloroherpeton thalassium (strain ATCC 35110 / GB-78) TaxID=517418 RepID=B3QVY1_CHLT3|nr:hypothetical protein [Chloroherpeton thalassium]ACF14635.1 hypothetical protein Ctha_2184 [Chloroherpeton thalassium ATCC 35110]